MCHPPLILQRTRSGFSFVEVLFAILILGVGLIMIAAIFPVAIKQSQITVEETAGRTVAFNAVHMIEAVANDENMPSTSGLVDKLKPAVWDQIKGNIISVADRRFAWVPMYSRNSDKTATLYILAVECRNQPSYGPAHLAGRWGLVAQITERFGQRDIIKFTASDPSSQQVLQGMTPGAQVTLMATLKNYWPDTGNLVHPYTQGGPDQVNPTVTLGNSLGGDTFELVKAWPAAATPDEYVIVDAGPDGSFNTADDQQFTQLDPTIWQAQPAKYHVFPNYLPLRFTADKNGNGANGQNQSLSGIGVVWTSKLLESWPVYVTTSFAGGAPGTITFPNVGNNANFYGQAAAGEGAYVVIANNQMSPGGPENGTIYRLGARISAAGQPPVFQLQPGNGLRTAAEAIGNVSASSNAFMVGKGLRDPFAQTPIFEGRVQDILLLPPQTITLPGAQQTSMRDLDWSKQPAEKQWPASDVALRYRPSSPEENGGTLLVENIHLYNVTDEKAIYASSHGPAGDYKQMIFRNLEINNVIRSDAGQAAGIHMDFLYIEGNAPGAPWATDVLVDNVYMHDEGIAAYASAQPLWLVADTGHLGTVTVRNLTASGCGTDNKIYAKNGGTIDTLIIENCPGQRFILSNPGGGTMGKVIVRNSPGIYISNVIGATIIYQ